MRSQTDSVVSMRLPALVGLLLLAGSALCTGCANQVEDTVDYRILLGTWRGQEHATRAKTVKEVVEKQAGWKDVTLIARYQETVLYWGHYKDPKDAKDDLNAARAFKSPDLGNVYLFTQARVEDVGQDIGPPQWNLANVDPQYVYTVIIAVFHDEPEQHYVGRRRIAVAACQELRDKGEEAYFFHDTAKSIVTVGLFRVNGVRVRQVPVEGGFIEQKENSREVLAVLHKYQTMQDNGAPLKMAVASKGRPEMDTGGMNVKMPDQGQRIGKLNEFYAPSYVIEIPKRPTAQDPFAGLGNP